MTTSKYPGAIDSFTDPSPTSNLNDPAVLHSTQHTNANDAIEAIETELGVSPSGSLSTVAARFAQNEGYALRGVGSPYGVVTPASAGIEYIDTAGTCGAWKWISTGTTNTSWTVTMGDTGVRSITPNSGSAALLQLRRVNNIVSCSVYQWTSTVSSGSIINPIPAGFFPSASLRFPCSITGGGSSEMSIYYVNSSTYHLDPNSYAVNTKLSALVIWPTGSAWPVVLP